MQYGAKIRDVTVPLFGPGTGCQCVYEYLGAGHHAVCAVKPAGGPKLRDVAVPLFSPGTTCQCVYEYLGAGHHAVCAMHQSKTTNIPYQPSTYRVLSSAGSSISTGDSPMMRSSRAVTKQYHKNQVIQHEGQISHVNCYATSNSSRVEMALLKTGDYFGGKGIFNNSVNIATLEAADDVICLVINRKIFNDELRDIMNQLQQAHYLFELFKNQL
ncbi:unnamed protein product [Adineta steineri]|uniref:Cyclic nucleotide-binding domain-containing protein n=1 Tax=Adineta steineri TaxID=433720 RepID=A0A819AMT6_9BILA|nr:unnamed protein product [Adineta steineri]